MLACVSGALRLITVLTAFAAEEDERVLWPLDVILITLLWSTFTDIGDCGTPSTMRARGGGRAVCGETARRVGGQG